MYDIHVVSTINHCLNNSLHPARAFMCFANGAPWLNYNNKPMLKLYYQLITNYVKHTYMCGSEQYILV